MVRQYGFSLFVLLLFTISTVSWAQKTDTLSNSMPVDTMDAVTVEATRNQLTINEAIGSISYLSASQLSPERGSATSFSDVTAEIPGLIAQDRNNLALGERIMMRGMGWQAQFGVRGIQMVQNGIPLTLADGQTSTTIIEPGAIQQVQAIRGPASGYWGNGSSGVIYLNTRPPVSAPSVSMRNSIGSYDLRKSYVQWNTNIDGRRLNGYASYLSTDGYRNHNSMEIIRLGTNADLYSSSTDLVDVTFSWLAKPKAQHPGSLNKEAVDSARTQARSSFLQTNSGEKAYQGQGGIRWQHTSGNLNVESTLYGIRRLLENRLPFGYITLERWAGGLRNTTQYALTDRWDISGGFDLSYQHDNRLERNNVNGQAGDQVSIDQLEEVLNTAGFMQTTYEINRWRFTGSLRYDWLEFSAEDHRADTASTFEDRSGTRNFSAISPYAGIQYNTNSIRYFANFGTAFQSPTTTELVNNPEGQAGYNPKLAPQRSVGGEAGIATLGSYNISSELALFYIHVNNLLLPYTGPDDETFFENAGSTRHMGIEWKLHWRPQPWPLAVTGSYSFTNAQFVDFPETDVEDNRVPGVPEHMVDARAVWRPNNWRVTGEVQWSDAYPANNSNTAQADSYTNLQLTVSRDIVVMNGDLSLEPFFQVQNMLDQQYSSSVVVNAFGGRFYEPAPPRTWKAGFSISWK